MSTTTAASTRAQAMVDGRHTESARRRPRVITALDRARAEGTDIGVSAIARAARVDRSFLYRQSGGIPTLLPPLPPQFSDLRLKLIDPPACGATSAASSSYDGHGPVDTQP
jgi:hypothetical protein